MSRTDPTTPPDHGRTPDTTPVPGGGSWLWDDVAGAWVPNDPQAAEVAEPKE